tara:strand:- start:1430 stop:1951 length:522 start_codon:yes stop_codon:yes gene_type:complete
MEVEYGGIKAKGGRLFIIISLIGTIGGGLWGFFELVKRYETMEATISSYVAPDLSGFDKRLDVLKKEISGMKELVADAQGTARDMRTDLKGEIGGQSDQIDAIDKRSRADGLETRQAMRLAEKEVRDLIADTSKRWDDKLTKVDSQIEALETKIDKKIMKALENPLAAMTKTK